MAIPQMLEGHGAGAMSLEAVWSLNEQDGVLARATRSEDWLTDAMRALRSGVPLPESTEPFVSGPYYRPPGSHRSFYYWPQSRGVLAIKGAEPACRSVAALLGDLGRPCYSPHSIAEHLIHEENKVPAALTLGEALHEADVAGRFQREHVAAYGELARVPLPLFVFRHTPEVEAALLALLAEHLSFPAYLHARHWIGDGLAVLVYYYPTPPVRVRDIDALLSKKGFLERQVALLALLEPESVIDRWVSLVARILNLGYAPGSLANYRTGLCCQPQNACLDGGFVDADSLTPLDALVDAAAVDRALHLSTSALVDSVECLITGSDATPLGTPDVRADSHHLRAYVVDLVRRALAVERGPGAAPRPQVERYFSPPTDLADLVERIGPMFPRPNTTFPVASQAFTEFGLSLISAAAGRQEGRTRR